MKQFGFHIEEAEVAPGTLGLLYDETPELTTADIRPFIWAILLYRGAVKKHEAVGAVTPLCGHSELYSGFSDDLDPEDDRTRLEWLVDEVLVTGPVDYRLIFGPAPTRGIKAAA